MVSDFLWRGLIANLAVVALLAAVWSYSLAWLESRPRFTRTALVGGMVGIGAVATMVLAVEQSPGVYIDLRAAVIGVGALFGGPIVAVVAVVIAGAFRLTLGGSGALLGIGFMPVAACLGLAARQVCARSSLRSVGIVGLGLAIGSLNALVASLLPVATGGSGYADVAAPSAAIGFLSTLTLGFALHFARANARERFILRVALSQAPNLQFIKNCDSAFIAANTAIAWHFGFEKPVDLIGKTDLDLYPEAHARLLFDAEQEMLRTGGQIVDFDELVRNAEGREVWLRSSKTPVRDSDGRVVGLVGVCLDITGQKRMEQELEESGRILELALTEMNDALVLFDRDGRLIFCNAQYLRMFDRTADVRRRGVHLADVLRATAAAAEEVNLPFDVEGWIEESVADLFNEGDRHLEMHDGRVLLRRNRPVTDGGALVVFSDVTKLVQAERALRAANDELSILAATDGLTGLANRRAFDAMLSQEIDRGTRDRCSLSLLLIDVDRFKAYNDIYGHLAGDDCLRVIAQGLRAAIRRPADFVARYGGEEFAVVLPDTDEAGANAVGAEIRSQLRARGLTHEGAESGCVTVSIGLAHFGPEARNRAADVLISRADEALYAAKAAGRDRIDVWRERRVA